MLGPQDLGQRVVVRRIVGIRGDRPVFSDALGHLVAIDEMQVTVQTRSGLVRVPRTEIVRAKRVPARRRPAGADIAALERAAALAWPAPDTASLGEWLLRAADGWTGRGNSALPLGDPGRSLSAAIDEVQMWYASRGLPARINVPLPLAAQVDAALDERGWDRSPTTLVQAAPLAAVLAGDGGPDLPPVALAAAPAPDWLAMVADRKNGLPPAAVHLLTAPPLVTFAAVRAPDGTLLAAARGAVTLHRLHLGLVEVAPPARRRGLARHVVRALAAWAAGLGEAAAHTAYLQVPEQNQPAVALYARLGFGTHHTYVTRTAPPVS
ncbi:MAG: N-acetylglutamate synthase [Micromonosporaceae bacterium]